MATVTLAGGEPVEYTDLHKALVDGSVAGAVVELIDNVDLAGKNWEPVNDFCGKFDGKGFIISNLTIAVESGNNLGLFGSWTWALDHAGICNFTIENVSISAPSGQNVGAVAGKNGSDDGIAISNVTVCGLIQIDAAKYVGGICGHNAYNKIIDCHVNGSEGSFIGNASGSQIGGIAGSSGEGTMLIANSSVSGVTIVASKQAGGIQGRLFYGNRVIGCSTEDVTLNVAGTTAGLIVGHIQLNGSAGDIHYVLNCTTDDEVNPLVGSDTDYPIVRTVIGNGFEGDFGSFTAGTFTADAAALADVTAKCAAGYAPVANQDGTYTITQVFPITVVNAGEKATVTIDQTGSVIPGAKITGTVSDVAEGFKAFVFVDGVKVAVDNEGKFEGTATASAKITVAYAKDSAWYLDPFVKNDGEVVKKMDFGVDRMGDIVLSADGSKLYSAPGWQNYIACDGGYTGLLQFNVPLLSSYVGSYFKIENGQLGSSGEDTSINSKYEAFRSIVPVGNDYVVIGQTRGAEIRHQDYPGMSAQSSIYPIGGDWGDTKFGGTTDGDSRYVCYSDINMGTAVTAAADPTLLQWHTAGVVSSDGKYLYLAQYARNEIVKLALSKDTEGKAVWTKTGIWWHTKDEDIFNGNACNALALLPTANGDVVFASLSDGRLVKLNETTLSGNTFVDHHEGATAKVADYKMDLVANLGTVRAMKVTGVADGLPHLQVFTFSSANSALKVYALTADGDLVSTTPIATYQGGNALITNGYYQNVVSSDDETIAFAHYEDKPDRSNYSCVQNYRMAVLTAKPAQVTIRTTFGTYEEGTDTMVDYGTDAKVAIAPSAGCTITSVKVNGEPLVGFNPAGFDFEEAAIARNVYIEMTQEKTPFIILISSAGVEKARYADLNEAFAAAAEGDTVKLLQDGVAGIAATNNVAMTFDLGGFELTRADGATGPMITANETLVITNGSINGGAVRAIDILADGDVTLDYIEVTGTVNGFIQADYGALTIGSNAVITANCDLMYAGDSIVNIYGTLNRVGGERPLMWAYGDTGVLNIYDGAVMTSSGADVIRSNGGAQIVNVYGGELTSGGYPVFYSYNSATTVYNIYGGKLKSTSGGIFQIAGNKLATITPFGADCKAQFNTLRKGWNEYDLDHYLAEGYAFVKEGDWYVVKQTYTVTLKNGDAVVDTQVVADGQFATNVVLGVEGFKGWTNENYTAAFEFETTAITADITLFAWIEAAGPDIPVNPDEELTDAGKAAAAEVAAAITGAGGDVNAWVAEVYGTDGAIPASVLNATTAANIALAVANDLPITINEPTFEVEASEATEGNVAAFEFTLKDGATEVEIKAATAKVKAMVKYTGDLATAFATAKDTEVGVDVANGKIKAQLVKQNGVNAGFMKVEPNPAPIK